MNNEMIWKVAKLGVNVVEFIKILAVIGIIERRDGTAAVYFRPGSEHEAAAFWNVIRLHYGFESRFEKIDSGEIKAEVII